MINFPSFIALFFFLHQLIVTASGCSPNPYTTIEDRPISCRFSGSSEALDGRRQWIKGGGIGLQHGLPLKPNGKQISNNHSRFCYTFPVSTWERFVCSFSHPDLYSGFGLVLIISGRNFISFPTSKTLPVKSPKTCSICNILKKNGTRSLSSPPHEVWGFSSGREGRLSESAPEIVYQASCSTTGQNSQASKNFKSSWKLPAVVGFKYILRLHFCDYVYEIIYGEDFSVSMVNKTTEYTAGVMKMGGRNVVAINADFEVTVAEELVILMFPRDGRNKPSSSHSAILSNSNVREQPCDDPKPRKFVYSSGGNAIATVVVVFITVVSIILHHLRVMNEKCVGKRDSTTSLPFEEGCRCFSLAEIQTATNKFDDKLVIGRGGFGKVYKGLVDSGATAVAIKRLDSKSNQGAPEFWAEIEMLSKLRHSHLVTLLGYCNESPEMILVYELMQQGTLADHLYKIHSNDERYICVLSWEKRLKMCIGAARGLDYLHTGTPHGSIHRDVKTTNILVDHNWVAKISDFGLCKMGTSHSQTHVSTAVKGTFGYLDPDYFLTHRLTKKSDVYAFGVVLLEVLCGRPAVVTQVGEEQRISLVQWAQSCIKEGTLHEIIEPRIIQQISSTSLEIFVRIAKKCLHSRSNARPTMAEVIARLECALASQYPTGDQRDEEEEEDSTSKKSSKGKLGKVIRKSVASLAKNMDIRWRRY